MFPNHFPQLSMIGYCMHSFSKCKNRVCGTCSISQKYVRNVNGAYLFITKIFNFAFFAKRFKYGSELEPIWNKYGLAENSSSKRYNGWALGFL